MRLMESLFIILTVLTSQAMASEACINAIAKVLEADPTVRPLDTVIASAAKSAIGRDLTADQTRALETAARTVGADAYTAAEVAQQEKLLTAAGFKADEIAKLRQKGVLGNSLISLVNGAPKGVQVRALRLKPLGAEDLKNLQDGKPVNYVVGEDGSIHVTSDALDFANDKLVVTIKLEGGSSTGSVLVREAGVLELDKATGSYAFKPRYGIDVNDVSVKEMMENISVMSPGSRVTYKSTAAVPHARAIKCLDVLSAQSNGKNFVLDRMITDNIVTVAAIGAGELMGAGRLQSETGRQVIMADLIGGNLTGYLGSVIGKQLVLKNSNLMTSMAVRSSIGMGFIEMQKGVHNLVVDEQQAQSHVGEEIAAFNRAHFLARLPVNHYFDKFMVKTLPNLIFNSCQKNPGLSVLVSPRSIRLLERTGSATLYYGLREAIVGQ